MSLFSRLFLLMLLAGMAPLVPTGALLFYYQSQAKVNALSLHESLSSVTATAIRQYMQGLAARMAFTERLDLSAGGKARLEAQLREALAANPDFMLAAVLDAEGRPGARAGAPETLRRFGGAGHGADPVFLQARKTGQVVLSSFDSQDGVSVCSLVFPIRSGRYLYVVANAEPLLSQLREQRIGETGHIFLADTQGHIFRFDGEPAPGVRPEFLSAQFGYRPAARLEIIPAPEGTFVGAYRRVPDMNLCVLTLQLRDEAFWVIRLTTSLIIFFLLAIATASYFSALYYARKLSRPISALIDGAGRVIRRDFSTPVPRNAGWGEFSQLIEAFNIMLGETGRYDRLQVDRLLGEKRKLDLLVGMMRDGVILADENGAPLFTNHIAAGLLDNPAFIALAADGASGAREVTQRMSRRGRGLETFRADAGGSPRWYRLMSEEFLPPEGGKLKLIVLRDVTFEHEIDAMKEDFFNSAAHDLRAPLLGMQGYMKLLEASCSGAGAEYLSAMKNSSARLFRLVEDILDIARMESGALRPKTEQLDFAETARRTADSLLPLIEEKGIKLSLPAGGGAPLPVKGDARMLERLLGNLLSNAIKFTPRDGKISVEYAREGAFCRVSVKDSGPGIPPAALEEVFEKYRRLDDSPGKGYGLGLAIARKICELHGGKIAAANRPEGGAEITFTLPA
ncbi:MAG: ATP-binding protein [Elusimicrobiales bacterium]|nr:ATP-binding protein [Elusimicrobiales bacterium]